MAAVHRVLSPEEIFIKAESEKELFATIGQLTEVQQRWLKAYFFEGMNYRQIAEVEGVGHSSISHSVKAALEKLNSLLK